MVDTEKTIELLERQYHLLRTISTLNSDYKHCHGHTFVLDISLTLAYNSLIISSTGTVLK